jgi:hypothetical protein
MQTKNEKRCAYCGSNGPFTREHVIPKFLYNEFPDQKFGYHKKTGEFRNYEAVVRDVCSECNNGPLAKLDAYGKNFFEENRLDRNFISRKIISIKYDYHLFLRWMLKISFNALRSTGGETGHFERCIDFILSSNKAPFQSKILIEVVQNEPLSYRDKLLLEEPIRSLDSIPTRQFRIGEVSGLDSIENSILCRFFSVNAFYFFYFLAPLDKNPETLKNYIRVLKTKIPQAILIREDRKIIKLKVSKRTALKAYEDQALREMSAWISYRISPSKSTRTSK